MEINWTFSDFIKKIAIIKNKDFLTQVGLFENMKARAEELMFPAIVYA